MGSKYSLVADHVLWKNLRLFLHSPMSSPNCSSYTLPNNWNKCRGTSCCRRRAIHSVSHCTDSYAFGKSKRKSIRRFQVQLLYPVKGLLSTNVCPCSSDLLPGGKQSSGCLASRIISTWLRIRCANSCWKNQLLAIDLISLV